MTTTENDVPSNSMPLALQSLFYKVQYNDTSVSTKDLTKSFGWDTYDSFMQHDVQELNRVVSEKLEDKMKGIAVEGTIQQLFEGHHMIYIECINVDYKSTRKESFYDLQLDVKGCRDIYASFDKVIGTISDADFQLGLINLIYSVIAFNVWIINHSGVVRALPSCVLKLGHRFSGSKEHFDNMSLILLSVVPQRHIDCSQGLLQGRDLYNTLRADQIFVFVRHHHDQTIQTASPPLRLSNPGYRAIHCQKKNRHVSLPHRFRYLHIE